MIPGGWVCPWCAQPGLHGTVDACLVDLRAAVAIARAHREALRVLDARGRQAVLTLRWRDHPPVDRPPLT